MAGRPRGLDDEAILAGAARVMGRVGPAGLTLAAVAREVGLVPGTLVQRFGSKRGLLLALADLSVRQAAAATEQARHAADSALGALHALVAATARVMDTPERFAHHLAFLCADLTDPELHERALAVHRAHARAVEDLLAEAVRAGELRSGADVPALTRTVQAVTAGAGLTWALDREGALAPRLRRELTAVLAPYTPEER
ncbi:TetR/AcrR family transcriptional regulator [Streptomyces sp. TLI_171]|uniref:TetR/AcrR family transcriptional regulator n=1 Tax=Streptomyces sp. TLI_171 TaxID=1938859 RepID=UPI000C1A61A8|nr:TetR/AcrR family transcriptional regulator [Streptomyces sp. TLI_171]RKE17612.1 TetR family transcriptional regulator [Streptomyces sp. TLI_171]